MARAVRTVIVKSVQLPRRLFRVFVELEGMYRNMVEQLAVYAVSNNIGSFLKLKALKYREMRNLYPQLPSHYIYTACQDASTRVKSFLRLKRVGLAWGEHPEIRSISVWLDDHLWRLEGCSRMGIATHRGWIAVELEPHKQYWRYVNRGWKLASEAKVKLDRRNRQLIIYLTFVRDVEEYGHAGFVSIDVNENNVTILVDSVAYLLETDTEKIVLGYHYRRKRVQEKYDKLYGVRSRIKRRIQGKLKEKFKKKDTRWKVANMVVRAAYEKRYAIVLEDLGKKPAENMVKKFRDEQLRHRIFQASFRGIQEAIEEKAREHGVPIVYVNPKNSSRVCPIHSAEIIYSNSSRVGMCSKDGELWHRDVVACYNLLLRACLGDGSDAPSPGSSCLDGSPVPLGSTAAHDPVTLPKGLWVRWNSLPQSATVLNRMKR